MFTFHNRYIPYRNIICFLVEGIGIICAVLVAHLIYSDGVFSSITVEILYKGFIISLFAQFCMFVLDLYDLKISFSVLDILFSVTFTTGFLFFLIGFFSFFIPTLGLKSNVYYLTGVFIFIFLFIWRYLLERYIERYSSSTNVLILGDGKHAHEVANLIQEFRRLGFNLVGFAGKEKVVVRLNPISSMEYWELSDIEALVENNMVNEIVVAPDDRRSNIPIKQLLEFKISGVQIVEWPEFYERLAGKIPVTELPPSFFVFNEGFNVSTFSKILTRVFSFIFAFTALIATSPILIVSMILIKIDSRGPAFYIQDRVGERGELFRLIKLRTMVEDAEEKTGAVWALEDDPRITKVGRFLRKFRFDELPQFINVIKGEMNIVGPRPERPAFVDTLSSELPYYSLRHSIKPGVTGWAQVKFSYGATIDESREKLEYDLFYLKNRSFKLDTYILLKTIKIIILGRGAK